MRKEKKEEKGKKEKGIKKKGEKKRERKKKKKRFIGDHRIALAEQALGQQPPVERLATNQVFKRLAPNVLVSERPVRNRPQDRKFPIVFG